MTRLTRSELVELCENRYFGNVVLERLDAVLACFTPDTIVVIRHGDNPERRFHGRPQGDALHISEFWKHLNANFDARFEDFEHVVDVEQQRIASIFLVTLAPKAASPYASRGTLQLKNCNYFWVEDGLIARMLVYYSNPDTGGDPLGKPSGYPPARRPT
jgi:hypothetical protein